MARSRIRTVKPEFFQHEGLFDLERKTDLPIRVSFVGLWTCCDREGRFRWRPRQLKVNILPYDSVDMERVLDVLASSGFIVKYEVRGELYGCIPSWNRHQVINNKESASEIPAPPDQAQAVDACGTREERVNDACGTEIRHEKAEGKGTEGKGTENLPLPPPKNGGGVEIWRSVLQRLKEDFANAYVFNQHFKENAYDKYFRDSWLVAIEDGVVILNSPQPSLLREGLRTFHQRLTKTFRDVAGFDVKFQLIRSEHTSIPQAESDSVPLQTQGSAYA